MWFSLRKACAFLFAFVFFRYREKLLEVSEVMVPPTAPEGWPGWKYWNAKNKDQGNRLSRPELSTSSSDETLNVIFKKRKVFFAMFIFGIGFRTIISFCVGPIQNEWISLSLRRIYPKVKFGNACSKNASHGSGLKMVKAFVMVDRSHSGSIVPPPHALPNPKVSKGIQRLGDMLAICIAMICSNGRVVPMVIKSRDRLDIFREKSF